MRQAFKKRTASPDEPSLTTTKEVSLRMGRVRQTATAPELAVREAARSVGIRFSYDNRDLAGSPDLANRKRKVAIFVHGCYWHRHPGCHRTTTPGTNRAFWLEKFARNVERDAVAIIALRELGYRVIVFWECQTTTVGVVRRRLARAARL